MKTILIIDDIVMAKVREEAARSGRTISEIVEAGLRLALAPSSTRKAKKLPPLPAYTSGGMNVDITDREALYDFLDRN